MSKHLAPTNNNSRKTEQSNSQSPQGEELATVAPRQEHSQSPQGEELATVAPRQEHSQSPQGEELATVAPRQEDSQSPQGEELATVAPRQEHSKSWGLSSLFSALNPFNRAIHASHTPQWDWNNDKCKEWLTAVLIDCGHSKTVAKQKAKMAFPSGIGMNLYGMSHENWTDGLGQGDGKVVWYSLNYHIEWGSTTNGM
jgi:hypothetical protein